MTDSLDISHVLSYILYAISGYCFAVFACRHSVFALRYLKTQTQLFRFPLSARERFRRIFLMIGALLFLTLAWIVLPSWLYSRAPVSAFVYLGALLYYLRYAYTH